MKAGSDTGDLRLKTNLLPRKIARRHVLEAKGDEEQFIKEVAGKRGGGAEG